MNNVVIVPTIRILKIASCPTLSGKSQLTYHLGCDGESKIYFRVYANSSSGYFNPEWVSAEQVGQVLSGNNNITCFSLESVFVGKSINNAGFLLATLFAEGLVITSEENKRRYQLADPAVFNAEVNALIETPIALDPNTKPKKVKKSA